jgi:hypothetical protein
MKRIHKWLMATALGLAASASPLYAQAVGGRGAVTPASPQGTASPQTGGTTPGIGTPQRFGGQWLPPGSAGEPGGGTAGAPRGGTAGAPGGGSAGAPRGGMAGRSYGAHGPAPWFSDTGIRSQLGINNNQLNRLKQAYGNAWNAFQRSLPNRPSNVNNQVQNYWNSSGRTAQRAQQANNLTNQQVQNYWNNFSRTMAQQARQTLTPQQFQRYQQLEHQFQGINALNNPAVQQELTLSAQQRQQLGRYAQQYNQATGNLYGHGGNMGSPINPYGTIRNQMNQTINSILTPQQQLRWRQMTGEPYNFPAPR